jgi:hypothetical protein
MANIDNRHKYSRSDLVRPGRVIHGVLDGKEDIIPGVYVTEADVAELWCAYKRQLYLANFKKDENNQQRGLTLRSFQNYLMMAKGLKLIRYIKTHPPEYELHADSLRYMTEDDMFQYSLAMRKVYKLTPKGLVSGDWDRISTAYHKKFPGSKKVMNEADERPH